MDPDPGRPKAYGSGRSGFGSGFGILVETEGNGDSERANERGPSLVGSLGLSCRYLQEIFVLPRLF